MKLSPKSRRNISRIVPYAVIWLLISWVIIISEVGLTMNQNLHPKTDISFTIPVLIFVNLANAIVGFLVGTLEVVYFEKILRTAVQNKDFIQNCHIPRTIYRGHTSFSSNSPFD